MNEQLIEWIIKGGGATGAFVAGIMFHRWLSRENNSFWQEIATEIKAIIVAKKRAVDLILEREEYERTQRQKSQRGDGSL